MYDQLEETKWYLDSTLHYIYLLLCITFLLGYHIFGDSGLVISALLVIHFGLLFSKLFCNDFLIAVVFGVRRTRGVRVQDRTMKFKRDQPPTNLNDTMRYKTGNSVEDVMFGRARYSQESTPSRNRNSIRAQQNDRGSASQSNYFRGSQFRHGSFENYLYKDGVNKDSYGRNIGQREPFQRGPHSNYNLDNRDTFTNLNNGQLIGNNYDMYDRGNRRPSDQRLAMHNLLSRNTSLNPRYDQESAYNSYRLSPSRQISTNYNAYHRNNLQLMAKVDDIKVAENELTHLQVKRDRAIRMILYLKQYFDQKIQKRRQGEEERLESVRRLAEHIFGPNFAKDRQTLLSRTRAAMTEYKHSSQISNQYFNRSLDILDKRDFAAKVQELRSVLGSMFYDYVPDFGVPFQRLKFYKEDTKTNILPGHSIQIVEGAYFNDAQNQYHRRIHRIGFDESSGFSWACSQQVDHPLNMEETFLITILRGRKSGEPNSKVMADLMAII